MLDIVNNYQKNPLCQWFCTRPSIWLIWAVHLGKWSSIQRVQLLNCACLTQVDRYSILPTFYSLFYFLFVFHWWCLAYLAGKISMMSSKALSFCRRQLGFCMYLKMFSLSSTQGFNACEGCGQSHVAQWCVCVAPLESVTLSCLSFSTWVLSYWSRVAKECDLLCHLTEHTPATRDINACQTSD